MEIMYWSMAKNFSFTPEQVDRMPYDRVVYFQELNKKYNQEQEKEIKK